MIPYQSLKWWRCDPPLGSHDDGSLGIVSPSCGVPGRGKVWDGPRFGGGTEGMPRLGPRQKSRKTAQPFERKSNCTKKKGTETTYNLLGLWSVVLVDCSVHVEEFGSPNILSEQFLKFKSLAG